MKKSFELSVAFGPEMSVGHVDQRTRAMLKAVEHHLYEQIALQLEKCERKNQKQVLLSIALKVQAE
jgi:hypothetical protein